MNENNANESKTDSIQAFRHKNSLIAIAAAIMFMSEVEPFSNFKFGTWVNTIKGQILRNHYFFSQIGGQIVGYYGWALTSHESAQIWIENRRELSYEECIDGPCVIIMCNRALSSSVLKHQAKLMRILQADREVAYWKRQTPNGTRLVKFNLQSPGVRREKQNCDIKIIG